MNQSPFVFVSFSPDDKESVHPILRALTDAGIPLWHREISLPGSRHPALTAEKIRACSCLLLLIGKDHLLSADVHREFTFADFEKKEILPVFLEDVKLPLGFQLRFSKFSAVHRNSFPNPQAMASFLTKELLSRMGKASPTEQKLSYPNGDSYEGQLQNGLPHGKGKYLWANGDCYEGEFTLGKLRGNGFFRFADGKTFQGSFEKSLPFNGKLFAPDQSILAVYVNGKKD